jgi:hypothetical protein
MLIRPRMMCPRTFFLGRGVPWMMCPLEDASPNDPSLNRGGGGSDVMLGLVNLGL